MPNNSFKPTPLRGVVVTCSHPSVPASATLPQRRGLIQALGPQMKTPIVEVRQQNLFVLTEFDGVFSNNVMRTCHNMINNKTCHVIDSNGDLWSFAFDHTNHIGIRRVFSSLVRNISYDQYTYTKEPNISVGRFREIIGPHQRGLDPDQSEMATALFESVGACAPSDPLRDHIHLLNL